MITIRTTNKRDASRPFNLPVLEAIRDSAPAVIIQQIDEAELDEMGSYVGNPQAPLAVQPSGGQRRLVHNHCWGCCQIQSSNRALSRRVSCRA